MEAGSASVLGCCGHTIKATWEVGAHEVVAGDWRSSIPYKSNGNSLGLLPDMPICDPI